MQKRKKMAIKTEPIHILTAEKKFEVEEYFAKHLLPKIKKWQKLSSKAIERVGHIVVRT